MLDCGNCPQNGRTPYVSSRRCNSERRCLRGSHAETVNDNAMAYVSNICFQVDEITLHVYKRYEIQNLPGNRE